MLNLALYHPQIPQNAGTLLRMGACLGVFIDLIRPFGFVFDDKKLRRAGMDYISTAHHRIHQSFDDFYHTYGDRRLIALDISKQSVRYYDFDYQPGDILVIGSEHYGFLKEDARKMSACVKIPMLPGCRSLNMAVAASIVVGKVMTKLALYNAA